MKDSAPHFPSRRKHVEGSTTKGRLLAIDEQIISFLQDSMFKFDD